MAPVPPDLVAALADRYTVEREVGQGGMATVFLANDLKHRRRVALKVFRPELAAAVGAERFLREITTTANLRHPHILPLYDSGEAGGFLFYVMPFVEGESLRDRLDREKQLPLDEALQIAREVADALSYAHSHDVVHRDIKPENILLEAGHAVVADFGIARAVSAAGGQRLTQTGLAVGTPTYMSPEQASGSDALDGRSDLYALGCVLYEMLAGQPPFTAATAEGLLRQHMTANAPAVTQHRPKVSGEVAAAIDRALAKNPADRFATASAFTEAMAAPERVAAPAARAPVPRLVWAIIAFVLLAMIAIFVLRGPGRQSADLPSATTLRQVTFSPEVEEYPSLSPDGRQLVFSRDVGGYRQLVLMRLTNGTEEQLTDGEYDNIQATWSADGEALLFVRATQPQTRLEPGDVFGVFVGGDIWRFDLRDRTEQRLVDDAYNPAVAPDGRLAFDAGRGGTQRIWVADDRGRNARQVSSDSSEAVTHMDPSWSPDGTRLVFQVLERTRFDIGVVDVGSGEMRRATNDEFLDVNPVWAPDGRAIDFSSYRSGGLNVWRLPVTESGTPAGPAVQITTGAGQDVQIAASIAGNRLAFAVLQLNADLWRVPVDPASGRPTGDPEPVVVTTREDSRGSWSPDGQQIAFNSDRAGAMNIWIHALADGSDQQLTRGPGGDYQPRWSPDGSVLVFFSARAGNADIWVADVATGDLTQLTTSPWLDINPAFSPDGRQVAFQSDRGGRMEVWVMNADGTEQRAVTEVGVRGHFLLWHPDGDAIYFRTGSGEQMQALVSLADGSVTEVPVVGGSHMSLAPNGTRIADVLGHQRIWVSPLTGGEPYVAFMFDDPEVRIDYPVWSPDGRWILFDRWAPEGGDVWVLEGW